MATIYLIQASQCRGDGCTFSFDEKWPVVSYSDETTATIMALGAEEHAKTIFGLLRLKNDEVNKQLQTIAERFPIHTKRGREQLHEALAARQAVEAEYTAWIDAEIRPSANQYDPHLTEMTGILDYYARIGQEDEDVSYTVIPIELD